MPNKQLHDYINAELQKGFTADQIKQNLLANGWPAQEIDNYFLTLSSPAAPQPTSSTQQKYMKFILLAVAVLLIVAGSTFYLVQRNRSASSEIDPTIPPTLAVSPVPSIPVSPLDRPDTQATGSVFEENLRTCTPYKETFQHQMTGETMEKEIVGETDGKCHYVEQMPNGGKLECRYTESERKAVAQYYIDVAAAESTGTSVNVDGTEMTAEYTLDGNVVENPLAEAMENGTCVVSGY